MSYMNDYVQSGVADIVSSFGEEWDLTLRMSEFDANEDGSVYVSAGVYTIVSVGYLDDGVVPSSWNEFVNELIPVRDLPNRAVAVSADLEEALESEFSILASDLEYRVEEYYSDWFNKEFGEDPEYVSVSVVIDSAVEQFSPDDLIEERRLIRDNS